MRNGMSASLHLPTRLSVEEFLTWDAPPGQTWQLVDGTPHAMAPGSRTHGSLQSELAFILTDHFRATGAPCVAVTEPGIVPRALASSNFRIPDLAVTCTGYETEETAITDPVLIVEILSPSNRIETWTNVWAYTSIPSVQEILVLRSTEIGADLLRRGKDGNWPAIPEAIGLGDLVLDSVGLRVPLQAVYRTTRLAQGV